jgi:3-oxoacyl-[acyl-carrier-protein] synthase II
MTARQPHRGRFQATREDGFVLGEGAAIVILETLESAEKRKTPILAEVIGFGSSNDAFRLRTCTKKPVAQFQAMRSALKDAAVTINEIDYISTHGTSTAENDSIERWRLKRLWRIGPKRSRAAVRKASLAI